jgi:hypothetical protein
MSGLSLANERDQMSANNQRAALAIAAVLALTPVTAEATIAQAVQFDRKVEQSAAIVLGRVVSQQSSWDANKQRILTYSKFRIEKTLKGFPSQEVTIVTPGGQVGDIAQDYVGIPRFTPGEDHVVFLRNTRVGPTVAFLEQGAYRVETDSRGERVVQPLVSAAVLVDTQRGVAVPPESVRSLSDFEGSVRLSIQRRQANQMKMIEEKKRQDASLWSTVKRNRTIVIIALLGAVLATWQLVLRRP